MKKFDFGPKIDGKELPTDYEIMQEYEQLEADRNQSEIETLVKQLESDALEDVYLQVLDSNKTLIEETNDKLYRLSEPIFGVDDIVDELFDFGAYYVALGGENFQDLHRMLDNLLKRRLLQVLEAIKRVDLEMDRQNQLLAEQYLIEEQSDEDYDFADLSEESWQWSGVNNEEQIKEKSPKFYTDNVIHVDFIERERID